MSDSLYRTPDEFLLEAIDAVRARGVLTDFNEGSALRTVLEAWAAMMSLNSLTIEQLRLNTALATAAGDALDLLAANERVARKQAVAATGAVTFTRQSTTGAMTIPAGSVQLATRSTPSLPSQTYTTTEDAVFADGVATAAVPAIADVGGVAGNLAAGVILLTVDVINGIDADGGVEVTSEFTGGTDLETDDALRVRVPLEVQGRVKGTRPAYLAAALRVPGVTSAQVLRAGETGPHGTLIGGGVEVNYQGAASLLDQVSSECVAAAEINDNPAIYTAASERLIAAVTVYVHAGADHAAITAAVKTALTAVTDTGVGTTVYHSLAIETVHAVDGVVSTGVPFTDFRKNSESPGTAHDIAIANGKYPALAEGDITVTVTDL